MQEPEATEITFFDCSVIYGVHPQKENFRPAVSKEALKQALAEAGVQKALVRRREQIFGGPATGNRLIAEDLSGEENLWGAWSVIPCHTHEIPQPADMLTEMKQNRIAAWWFIPDMHYFTFHPRVLGEWLDVAVSARIPILCIMEHGIDWADIINTLEKYPELTVILTLKSVWPPDRYIRPLLRDFPHTYIELSRYWTDGGLEELVEFCGPERILFGSGFDSAYFGGIMLMIKHAQIPEKAKRLIASGNLERILSNIKL